MNLNALFKPEYIFQPSKLLNKLLPESLDSNREFAQEALPWGVKIRVRPYEEHGKILSTLGVIDLAVTEALFRLTDKGEVAVDVGANIGYMTSILSVGVGENGKVVAFEAHPEIFNELKFNIQDWFQAHSISNIEINHLAVSDSTGELELFIPLDFQTNRGLASVQKEKGNTEYNSIKVLSTSLDDRFIDQKIGVFKIDVEGHELSVLRGAKRLLQQKKIRDCIFEEHENYPTPTTKFLEEMGYTIFRIHRHLFGLTLLSPNSLVPKISWLPTSFLATTEPKRALDRCKSRGWNCLKRKNTTSNYTN